MVEVPDYIGCVHREKVQSLVAVIEKTLPSGQSTVDLFVSNPRPEGGRAIASSWLFTQNLVVMIRDTISGERLQYDIAPFKDSVDWVRFNSRNYEFGDVVPESDFVLEFTTKDGFSGELTASGEGCSHLFRIYQERFLPNFEWTLCRDENGDSGE